MLSLQKLEIFNQVAMEGSFSKAAEVLMLSQPSVSQHIRDLELSLGRELFSRGPRGVVLTAAGETLLDYTRCILRLMNEAEEALQNLDMVAQGQLALGATPGASVYLLPDWIRTFHKRFPDLSIFLRTDTTQKIADDIIAGKLDLGIVEGELLVEPPLVALGLQEIKLFVIIGPGHELWDRSQLLWSDLVGQPFIIRQQGSQTRAWIDQVMAEHGIALDIIAEFDNPEAIKQAVAAGMGISILAEWGLDPEMMGDRLKALPLGDADLSRELKLLLREQTKIQPAERSFLIQLADLYPHLTRFITPVSETLILDRTRYKASSSCRK